MGKNTVRLTVAIVLLLMSASAVAATRYVSDQLSINMRRGPSTSYGISELIEAGTRVQTLGQTNGWTKIRTPEGEVGYVLTRFLSTQPAARDRIQDIKAQLARLKKQNKGQVAKLKEENKALRAELAEALHGSKKLGRLKRELVAENEALKAELERIKRVSANALQIKQQNQKYREKLLVLKSELERLRSENKALKSRREGMKIGALILVGGVILGLVLPMFRRRRGNKSNWDSL